MRVWGYHQTMLESDSATNEDPKRLFVFATYGAGVCAAALTMVAIHMAFLSGVAADTRVLIRQLSADFNAKVDTPVAAAAAAAAAAVSVPTDTVTTPTLTDAASEAVPDVATDTTSGAATSTASDAAADVASGPSGTSGAPLVSATDAAATALWLQHSMAMYARRRAMAELLAVVAGLVAFGCHTAAGLERGKFISGALCVSGAYALQLAECNPYARRPCVPDALRRWGLAPTPAEAAAALQQAVAVTAYAALSMLALPGGGARFSAALRNPSFWGLLIAYVIWGTAQHWVAFGVCARALEHLLATSGHRAFVDPRAAEAVATVVVGTALGLAHALVWASSGAWVVAVAPLCMVAGVAWASIFMRHACLCPLGACYGLLFTLYYFVVLDTNPFRQP